ncbi:MAG TPA: hypothetical protein PLZ12_13895 [Saprospiraceae bacterium]|nr:hypothetical protein [Saprospiraceae bacterium]
MKNTDKDINTKLGLTELETIFYDQFSKNTTNNSDFLLRLFVVIGSVIGGYGYLLLKFEIEKYDVIVVFFMLIFAEMLLLIYFKTIYDEGYAFRRDQLIVYRILKKHELIAENENQNSNKNKPFTFYYNPLKKFDYINHELKTKTKHLFFIMPAFHNTVAMAIFFMQILLYISFCIKISHFSFWVIAIVFALLTSSISIIIVLRKNSWLKKMYSAEFEANTSHL